MVCSDMSQADEEDIKQKTEIHLETLQSYSSEITESLVKTIKAMTGGKESGESEQKSIKNVLLVTLNMLAKIERNITSLCITHEMLENMEERSNDKNVSIM